MGFLILGKAFPRTVRRVISFLAISMFALSLSAASITWTSPQNTTSNFDIVNPGSVIQALDLGGNGNTNVTVGANAITFVGTQAGLQNFDYSGYYFRDQGTSVDANFDKVLDSPAFDYRVNGVESALTISFTGLTPNTDYLLQAFISDNGGAVWNTQLAVNGVSTVIGTNNTPLSDFVIGQISLGAGETSIDLVVSGAASGPGGTSWFSRPLLNAIVLSSGDLPSNSPDVPEPATLLLTGAGLLGIAKRFGRASKG